MSMQTFAFVGVFLIICDCYANPLQLDALPQNIKICQSHDNYYSTCLANAIQDSWPEFVKGIPELESPTLEPLKIAKVDRYLNAGPFVGGVVLSNITFYGLASATFLSAHSQFIDNRVKLDLLVKIPKVVIECDYKAQGAVDSLAIGGKGHFNVSMDGLTAKWTLNGYVKNDRWIVKHFRINPDVKQMKVYFSDLFSGNRMLNDAALLLVNQYWPIFFNGMKPIVVELSDARLTDFVNRIVFSKVALSKIFP